MDQRFLQRKETKDIRIKLPYVCHIRSKRKNIRKPLDAIAKSYIKVLNLRRSPYEAKHHPLKLVFSGNIGTGRYKTLGRIASALNEINKDGIKAVLYIYTSTPCSYKMKHILEYPVSVRWMKFVSSENCSHSRGRYFNPCRILCIEGSIKGKIIIFYKTSGLF